MDDFLRPGVNDRQELTFHLMCVKSVKDEKRVGEKLRIQLK